MLLKRKIVPAGISLVLLAGLVAGCSPDNQTPEPPVSTETSSNPDDNGTNTTDPGDNGSTDPGTDSPTENAGGSSYVLDLNDVEVSDVYKQEFSPDANFDALNNSIINGLNEMSTFVQFQSAPFVNDGSRELFYQYAMKYFENGGFTKFKESIDSNPAAAFGLFPHLSENNTVPGIADPVEVSDGIWQVSYSNPQFTGVNFDTVINGMNFQVDKVTSVPMTDNTIVDITQTITITMIPGANEWLIADFSSTDPVAAVRE